MAHADLLELRRVLYFGVFREYCVNTVPEFDAFQVRRYSRDTGTGNWNEQGIQYRLPVAPAQSCSEVP